MLVEIKVGSVEVKKVIGMRWPGIKYAAGKVLSVPSRVRGSWLEGVRMSLVLAASIGASRMADMAAAAVVIRIVAAGDAEARMDESGTAPDEVGTSMSFSATPSIAAKKLLKNVSIVRASTPYTNVELVPRHIASAPPLDDRAESASRRE